MAEFHSLALKALRALGEILESSNREPSRVAAALGVLRLAERLARLDPHPQPDRPAPAGDAAPEAPGTALPQRPKPQHADTRPLTTAELDELRRFFPHVDPRRFRRPRGADVWRAHLAQARRWDDHWRARRQDDPPAPDQPRAP